jgi:hypothetical protein
LNRLRTLALAVVNLTSFNLVTAATEDRKYFDLFDQAAQIDRHHQLIQESCEVLYNVQVAETQGEEIRRQNLLNRILLLLTSFTLVSVTVDAYNFVREQESLIRGVVTRGMVLLQFVLLLSILVTLVMLATRDRRRGQ